MLDRAHRAALCVCKAVALAAALIVAAAAPTFASPRLKALGEPYAEILAAGPALTRLPDGSFRFEMTLSQAVEIRAFTLSAPNRLVIDLPELDWAFRSGEPVAGPFAPETAVLGVRNGLLEPGRSRLVIDLGAPASVRDARVVYVDPVNPSQLVVEFTLGSVLDGLDAARPAVPSSTRRAARTAPVDTRALSVASLPQTPTQAAQPPAPPAPRRRPTARVVVLDPGHGGRDPGAGANGLFESGLTLDFARMLKAEIEAVGPYHVVLTRDDDVFVSLERRVEIAQEAQADLFISIHADSLRENRNVSGASVYTLSERASDALAHELAERENEAGALPGAPLSRAQSSAIREIIVDYARRNVAEVSHRFAETVVDEFTRNRVRTIGRRPHRQAGFKVLKNFSAPSVLVELGFVTNATDRANLREPAWRRRAARALAASVHRFAAGDLAPLRVSASRR